MSVQGFSISAFFEWIGGCDHPYLDRLPPRTLPSILIKCGILALYWTLSGELKLKIQVFLYVTLLCTRRLVSYQYHCENLWSCNCAVVYIGLCYMCFTKWSHRNFKFSEEDLTDHKNLNITHNIDIIKIWNFRMKRFWYSEELMSTCKDIFEPSQCFLLMWISFAVADFCVQ